MRDSRAQQEWNETLRRRALENGAELFGVADLALAAELPTDPPDLVEGFSRAVVLGVKLSDAVVEQCLDGPTPLYQHIYTRANEELDRMTFDLANWIEARGHRAAPLPASKLLDTRELTGNLSYKALGRLAGLGWQGKSLLLVSPELGPRFRMGVVLTDMPLEPGEPIANRCGSCTACTQACPAGAIRNVNTEDHYTDRNEALEFSRCAHQCMEVFPRRPHIEKPICGVCVRVCPWGQTGKK